MSKIPDELDKQLYGNDLTRVYGPYSKDGRQYIMLGYKGFKTNRTYAKYLMERSLGKTVKDDVHHVNLDKTDDRVDNFELKSRAEHSSLHAKDRLVMIDCTCHGCGKEFKRYKHRVESNRKYGYNNCCSARCGRIKQAPVVKLINTSVLNADALQA